MRTKQFLSELMRLAWQFVKRNGFTMAEAMKVARANMKLRLAMKTRIVKFYFQKVDGSIREAYGTTSDSIVPATAGNDTSKKNDTVQTYFDTGGRGFDPRYINILKIKCLQKNKQFFFIIPKNLL
ncbi:MAG: SH3 beta-barrel fold-containing protein [Tannerella sp.]|jgi:hypothetical protein|nr:SH3 beta-barrel fold-containing protein [Tannerella sp.]